MTLTSSRHSPHLGVNATSLGGDGSSSGTASSMTREARQIVSPIRSPAPLPGVTCVLPEHQCRFFPQDSPAKPRQNISRHPIGVAALVPTLKCGNAAIARRLESIDDHSDLGDERCPEAHQAGFQVHVQSGPMAATGDQPVCGFEGKEVGVNEQSSGRPLSGVFGRDDLVVHAQPPLRSAFRRPP